MTRLSRDVIARVRAKYEKDARPEYDEERSGERYAPSAEERLRWLASESLRPPTSGHVDVVRLPRRRR